MTYITPCADPHNDPNDWFISKDGKQYPADDLPGLEEILLIAEANLRDDEELTPRQIARAEDDALREQLRKRRHAKDACHIDCLIRTKCLAQALDNVERHGTWGGYHEEELRAIRAEIDRRNNP